MVNALALLLAIAPGCGAALVLAPVRGVVSRARFNTPQMTATPDGPAVELVDDVGDIIRFAVTPAGEVQMFDNDELVVGDIETLSYTQEGGLVSVDASSLDAEFNVDPAAAMLSLAKLRMLADEAGVMWGGDEPVQLPAEVDALLTNDELKNSRPGVCILWLE